MIEKTPKVQTTTFSNAFAAEIIETPRIKIRVHDIHRIKAHSLKFSYEPYYQPSLNWSNNYRYHGEAFIELPFSNHFSLRSGLNYNYESNVLKYIKAKDVNFSWGLSFSNFKQTIINQPIMANQKTGKV